MGRVTTAGGSAPDQVADEVLLARAYLNRVAEPASIPLWALVRERGPVAAADAVRRGEVADDVAAVTSARRSCVDPHDDLEAAGRHGIRLVVPESAQWPHFALAALELAGTKRLIRYRKGERAHHDGGEPVPPLALWVRGGGDLLTAGVRSVAIVGARAATSYGEHVSAELAYGLARRDVTVVSGGAYGIDAAAHRSALAADGSTMLISAGGLDRPYPPGNDWLYERVAESGLLVSERPPGSAPHRGRFLTRNRLIAALATGTIVVEASRRSGALNTARHAQTLGRPLMAVPGPVTSALSLGCHDLLRRDEAPASLVTSVDDVLAVVGSIGEASCSASQLKRGKPADALREALDGLDPIARQVFDGLPARHSAREDELARRSGVSPVDVLRALPMLHLAGLVDSDAEGYRIAATVHASSHAVDLPTQRK
jgi:DNA processing protein